MSPRPGNIRREADISARRGRAAVELLCMTASTSSALGFRHFGSDFGPLLPTLIGDLYPRNSNKEWELGLRLRSFVSELWLPTSCSQSDTDFWTLILILYSDSDPDSDSDFGLGTLISDSDFRL